MGGVRGLDVGTGLGAILSVARGGFTLYVPQVTDKLPGADLV